MFNIFIYCSGVRKFKNTKIHTLSPQTYPAFIGYIQDINLLILPVYQWATIVNQSDCRYDNIVSTARVVIPALSVLKGIIVGVILHFRLSRYKSTDAGCEYENSIAKLDLFKF